MKKKGLKIGGFRRALGTAILPFALLGVFLLVAVPVVSAHTVTPSTLEIEVGKTGTFTVTDPTGCVATIQASVADPTIASVFPTSTGPVVSQVFWVTALKIGQTTITVSWQGADPPTCAEVASASVTIDSVQPRLSISPTSLDFGEVEVNSSKDMAFTVTNGGTGILTGRVTPPDAPSPFSIVSGDSFSLGAGASQTVTVRFSPTVEGSVSGTAVVGSSAGGGGGEGGFDVPLTGTGISPVVIGEVDIHPIQVVQRPPGRPKEETIRLVAEKATMVRVFVTLTNRAGAPVPDGTVMGNVRGICQFAGQKQEITADLQQIGGVTRVMNPTAGLNRSASDSFNFFTGSSAVLPGAGKANIVFDLSDPITELPIATVVERFDFNEFLDTDGDSSFNISYVFVQTDRLQFANVPSAYENIMSDYFEHVISVYPIPRSKASWHLFREEPITLSADFLFVSGWSFLAGLEFFGSEDQGRKIDRFAIIVPGREGIRQKGFVEEQHGAGTLGITPYTMFDNVFVQSDAPEFTLAHEFGHTYGFGLWTGDDFAGHHNENANDGWDVREVTGSGPKPEAMQLKNALMFPTANSSLNGWITYQEYDEFLDKFVGGGSPDSKNTWGFSGKLLTSDTEAQDLLFVSGIIPLSGEHTLFPFAQSFGTPDPVSLLMGDDYSIVILSKPGKELSRVDFDADFIEFGEGGDVVSLFAFTMPFSKKAKKIELRKNDRILESRKISKSRPSVSITNISKVDSTTYEVKIKASDKDKDTLNYLISYTPDGERFFGVDYEWIEEGKTFQFDISHLPGSEEGKIRVLVTDGVRSATAFSSAFKVPNQPPMVSIINPIGNAVFEKGGTFVLSGSVMDQEDGNLPEASLTWQSDQNGTLGTGDILEVSADDISTGTHTITFIAKDSSGAESSTSTSIVVVETAKPDAVVQDIGFSPSVPAVGDDITISALITNFGKDATGTVTFFDGDPDSGGTQISSSEIVLSANSTTKASASWTPSTSGNKSIFARISGLDPTEEVTDNNTMSETIEIFSGASLSVSTSQLEFGDEETLLNFYIENVGGGTLDWSITESGDDQDAISVSVTSGAIPGGRKEFITVKLNRPGKDNNTHNVTLKVSSDGGDSEIKVSYQDKR